MQIIYLDISNKGVVPTIYAKQGDVGRKFLAIINDGGVPYAIPEDATISVWYQTLKNNNAGTVDSVSFEDNKVEVSIDPVITTVSGEGILCLTISFANGDEISTWNIPYDVELKPGLEPVQPPEPIVQTAVLYTKQSLTPTQQSQARENIGAAAVGEGGGITIAQTTGESEEAVMSQKAVTEAVLETASHICDIDGFKFDTTDFKNGTIRIYSDGQYEYAKYRVCSEKLFLFPYDLKIECADGFRCAVGYYENGVIVSDEGYATSRVIPANQQFKIFITRVPEDYSETADVALFVNSITLYNIFAEKVGTTENKLNYVEKQSLGFSLSQFACGTLTTGEFQTYIKYRVATPELISFDIDVTIMLLSKDYRLGIHYIGDDGNFVDSGWTYDYCKVPKGTKFRMLIGKYPEDTTITPNIEEFVSSIYIDKSLKTEGYEKNDLLNAGMCRHIMHRGDSANAPENSLPAFRLAGKHGGVWGIETDIRITSDGVYVCMHDPTIDRTTNGTGRVYDMTYEQLLTYDIDVNAQSFTGNDLKVPTLEQYLKVCKKYGCVAVIELEPDSANPNDFVSGILDIVHDVGMLNSCLIISFDEELLNKTNEANPTIPCLRLCYNNSTPANFVTWLNRQPFLSGLDIDCTTPNVTNEVVKSILKQGKTVGVWCPSTSEEFDNWADMGVDFITSNYYWDER